ncbi:hypothetical protein BN2476_190018 [Paraburkholderia piptadeniae]|uniref:Uncharacterized protein n=1 Tax=Paraburkholderia piptadeniae TaxID=1701573 RepID=A0A1N7RUM3_9BURK|nr:hypothetical protein BN2476_190018 [Paraburkholderia piptadeniae]
MPAIAIILATLEPRVEVLTGVAITLAASAWRLTHAVALTQEFCYRAVLVASCNLLPIRMLAGTTYD